LFHKFSFLQSADGALAQSPFARRRKMLKLWFRAAWTAALLGLILAVGSVITLSPTIDGKTITALAGIGLLMAGASYSFPHSRRLERALARSLQSLAGAETEKLEEIKDAHWALADRASHYRQLLDAQDDFVIRRSIDGQLVFANKSFCDAFEVRSQDVFGTIFRPPLICEEEDVEPPLTHSRRKVQLLRTRYGERWIAWDERELRNDRGECEIQSVGRDITEERRVAAQLKDSRDQAEAANRAKSRFLAAMSHEIRTPMNGILGMISLLRETPLDKEQRTCVRVVEDSARALLVLIDDILDFSKIEAGKLELVNHVFSLRRCLEQAVQLLSPEAMAKGLALTSVIAPDTPQWVRGDEMRVRQILLNLLSNAVKFTDAGRIDVSVALVEGGATPGMPAKIAIEVRDTGIGFSAATMQRLFDEFEQGEAAASRYPGGTGLGLAISKRLARAMGGDIVAKGVPEEGATFTVMLGFEVAQPCAEPLALISDRVLHMERLPHVREITAMGGPSVSSRFGREFSVLVAEDNRINALLVRKVIERAGGNATIVEDGKGAITAAREALELKRPAFDLILMDVQMPGIDGLVAAKSIKALYAERAHLGLVSPPIIALTANAFPEDRERCSKAGMDDYLAKPFDVQHLHEVMGRWLLQRTGRAPPAA
jgi:signal transduction histidine kinase/CheY-like chemotaxis protein